MEVAAAEAADKAAVDEVVEVVDEAAAELVAHTVFLVGEIVKAVTVKSGVPPAVQVQHGSPKASPLVMLMVVSVVLKSALQKVVSHVSEAAEKAVAKSVNWDESLSGWPSAWAKLSPFGIFFRYELRAWTWDTESTAAAAKAQTVESFMVLELGWSAWE